jgi:DNA processing protein
MSREACDRCLARTWLIRRLAGHLESARSEIDEVLALDDGDLIAAVGGGRADVVRREFEQFDSDRAREIARAARLEQICRCDPSYPNRLRELRGPPAVLHVGGGLERFLKLLEGDPVALVGARRPSPYGLEMARAIGRGLGAAGITVLSGMALGIDSAAHHGTLTADGATISVLPAGADRPYPPSKRELHRQILERGAAVSELAPRTGVWRWMFPARNRVIAALAAMTVVVEATDRSGALLTARLARELGRPIGAVPGRVTSPQAAGPHRLLAGGALVVRDAQDILDGLFGSGVLIAPRERRPDLPPELQRLLAAIADGVDTAAALSRTGVAADGGLAALAMLELTGYVRREPGGRFSVVATP